MQNNGQGSGGKRLGRPLPFNRQVFLGAAALLAAAVLLIIGLYPRNAIAPEASGTPSVEGQADPAGVAASTKVEEGCELIQHMTYTRCGHELDRRIQLPQELIGKTREDVEAAYDGWQVTEFLPKRITMARRFDLFCADHLVLMPDSSGTLCIYQNKYGDAMVLTQSLDLSLDSLPDAAQEEIRLGKGFDSYSDLEQWLEGMES